MFVAAFKILVLRQALSEIALRFLSTLRNSLREFLVHQKRFAFLSVLRNLWFLTCWVPFSSPYRVKGRRKEVGHSPTAESKEILNADNKNQ